MLSFLPGLLVLFLVGSSAAAAQTEASLVQRRAGVVFKDEVDGLIAVLRDTARAAAAGAPAPGVLGDGVASTAKILVAMANCHRRYHRSDGPVVRPSLDYLLRQRRADGSFGDAASTSWAAAALAAIDPDGCQEEIAAAGRWLAAHGGAKTSPFDGLVADVLAAVRADRPPELLARAEALRAWSLRQQPQQLARAEAAEVLLALVACQVANRRLDDLATHQGAAATWSPAQQKAFAWLLAQQQNGVFSVQVPARGDSGPRRVPDPGLTGFGLAALQTKPKQLRTASEQETIEKGLRWLLTQQHDDGTFGEQVPNYTTCVVVGALVRWGDAAAAKPLQQAQRAILAFQNSEASGYQRSDRDYGSIGYGSSQRGDLSNLHFSLEALRATGLPPDHEAFQKALVFLQRTQNLKSVNDFAGKVPDPERPGVMLDATSGDDGGAAYYPGNSAAGYLVLPDGKSVPRSYGSMTYALLKAYTLAGLPAADPRVAAAVGWIQANWTLAVNPGADPALGEQVQYQGLYYYYMVLAQALDLAGVAYVERPVQQDGGEPAAERIDWRQALRAHLEALQQADGSWVNGRNARWMEGLPLLCTCYALAALELCR